MKTRQQAIDDIASTILKLETLNTRNVDNLDFHELAIWQIKEALQAAYSAGLQKSDASSKNLRS
ncbi:DUF6900 domain-containing protein [Endozoicomonas atrinae]|uniref:DUF6900 domain-containing protein n=1 Tax=Endozoicomonas atrinae TaxID=1333660 RepID=UPI0008268761|nr:hypothetical protein [Endozoicomonas atrinae]